MEGGEKAHHTKFKADIAVAKGKVIRFDEPGNKQDKYVKWANDYLELNESPQRLYATRLKR